MPPVSCAKHTRAIRRCSEIRSVSFIPTVLVARFRRSSRPKQVRLLMVVPRSTRAGSEVAGLSSTIKENRSSSSNRFLTTHTVSVSARKSESLPLCFTTRFNALSPPCTRITRGRKLRSIRGDRNALTATTRCLSQIRRLMRTLVNSSADWTRRITHRRGTRNA